MRNLFGSLLLFSLTFLVNSPVETCAMGQAVSSVADAAKDVGDVNVKPPPAPPGRKRSLMDTIAKLGDIAKRLGWAKQDDAKQRAKL